MDLKYKLCLFFLAFVSIFAFNTKVILAVEPELSLYPASGTVDLGRDFMVDVLVDTKGQEVVLVRAVLKFDPELVQVKTAQRNEDIFCDWPEGEQLIDNDEGVLMATGFCQSGVDELYMTAREPDVFVRLTFETIAEGLLILDWEYSGRDEPLNSVIISDGSPPQNILNVKPDAGEYTIGLPPKTPETGIPVFENISSTFVLGGGVFLLALITNILLDPKRKYFNKSRTVVIYDDKKN